MSGQWGESDHANCDQKATLFHTSNKLLSQGRSRKQLSEISMFLRYLYCYVKIADLPPLYHYVWDP